MDAGRFDAFARALAARGTRRAIGVLLATMPLAGGLLALLGDASEARRRRHRRKARHGHGKKKRKRKNKRHRKCKPDPLTQTCAGKCGEMQNNCNDLVDCGPCACGSACSECEECDTDSGQCVPNPATAGEPCGETGQVCQANGGCACDDDSCGACSGCGENGLCTAPCGGSGCCDAELGCQPGDETEACGVGGNPCRVCSGDHPTCGVAGPGVCGCIPFVCPATACGTTPDGCGSTVDCGGCDNFLRPICVNNACAPCSAENLCPEGARCCEGACLTAEMCCIAEDCGAGADSCTDFSCRCGTGDACSASDAPDCCGTDGACTNVLSDPANCGQCGRVCEPYETCKSGTCACDVCSDGLCDFASVQDAIDAVTEAGTTVHICPGSYQETLTIRQDLNLVGAGAGTELTDTVINANGAGNVLSIQEGVTVSLTGLHITGGQAATDVPGGGIQHQGTSLTMTNCTIANNTADAAGGILNNAGALTMTNCTVSGNIAASDGGGLVSLGGTITMTNCTISGNTAAQQGGGMLILGGTVTLIGTRVDMNTQTASSTPRKPGGGGIFINAGGAVGLENECNVVANVAEAGLGGGIYNLGSVAIDASSAVEGNQPDDCVNGPGGTGPPACAAG